MAFHLHNHLFLKANCASGLGDLVTEKTTMLTSLALAVGHMAAREAEQAGKPSPKDSKRTFREQSRQLQRWGGAKASIWKHDGVVSHGCTTKSRPIVLRGRWRVSKPAMLAC